MGAHTFNLSLLKHTQQFGLQLKRHFADFIEENGPALGKFKLSGLAFARPGKGAAFVPKKGRLKQRGRYRRAVDRDKTLLGPWRSLM